MSTDLVHINTDTQQAIQKGGIGFDDGLFRLQPVNLELTQRMSKSNGTPGKFRVTITGQEFDEMRVVLLFKPAYGRTCHEKGGQFGGKPPICFSTDGIAPHPRALQQQALQCQGCHQADWSKYEKTKNPADKPACNAHYTLLFVDRKTKIPYRLQLRKTQIAKNSPFKKAMAHLAMLVAIAQSNGENPNIFDFSFTIKPRAENNGQYYGISFSDFAQLKPEDRKEFGNLYAKFVESAKSGKAREEVEEQEEELNEELGQPAEQPIPNIPSTSTRVNEDDVQEI